MLESEDVCMCGEGVGCGGWALGGIVGAMVGVPGGWSVGCWPRGDMGMPGNDPGAYGVCGCGIVC